MARPPHAREKVLAAYLDLLVEGDGSATMDAVAARAGVSKGGLLYHFPSKDALATAALDRFTEAADADVAAMAADPDGPVRNFIRTSWEIDTDLDNVHRAAFRLAQTGHTEAIQAIERLHDAWLALLIDEVGDASVARAVMLIGDGLYHQATQPGTWAQQTFENLDDLMALVDRLIGR